jgi:hypothetical protein
MFKDMGDRIYKKQQSLKYINDKYNIKLWLKKYTKYKI